MSEAMHALKELCRPIWNLHGVRSLLGWDQQVLMPPRGSGPRAQQMATLEHVIHDLIASPRFADALYAAESAPALSDLDQRYLRRARREHDLAAKVPSRLVEERARATSLAFEAWVHARKEDDFGHFLPHLKEVFRLTRELAEHRGFKGHVYDAMIDEYEPGMTTTQVQSLFEGLLPSLTELVRRIAEQPAPSRRIVEQSFPEEGQKQFVRYLLEQIGFDFEAGRLDKSAHPFCSGSTSRDVRLTDRFDPRLVTMAIFGGLHEGGHGLYEQGSPSEWDGTPLGGGTSLGVHESQSRLWENLVGRSQPFWQAHFPRMRATFPHQLSGYTTEDFYRAVNYVKPDLIRVEADEVTYTLHIALRFELERGMLDGTLDPADLPDAWNQKMKSYLGVDVPSNRVGCLQDIHWSDGLIGYFPTYSLGNLIASQLWVQIRKALPDLDGMLAQGRCAPLLEWLRTHIHQHASSLSSAEVIASACGGELSSQPFLDYLWDKYGTLYGLTPTAKENSVPK